VSAEPTVVHVPAPAGERWKVALATPEPPSAELEVRLIVPLTVAAAAGAVRLPVGAVLSTVTVIELLVVELLEVSVATAVRVWLPADAAVVSQTME
jgi:hypothetical protein